MPWPDCKEVQCKQLHDCLDSLLVDVFGITDKADLFAVGKMIVICREIDKLRESKGCPNCAKTDMQLKVIRETKPEYLRIFIHCNYCGFERLA